MFTPDTAPGWDPGLQEFSAASRQFLVQQLTPISFGEFGRCRFAVA